MDDTFEEEKNFLKFYYQMNIEVLTLSYSIFKSQIKNLFNCIRKENRKECYNSLNVFLFIGLVG